MPRLRIHDAWRGGRTVAALLLLSLLIAAAAFLIGERPPRLMPDEFFYLSHVMAIGEQGRFALAHPDLSQPAQEAISLPGYPYFLYGLLSLDSTAYADALCAHRAVHDAANLCQSRFIVVYAAQTGLMGLAIFAIAMIGLRISGRPLLAVVAAMLAAVSGLPGYYAGLFLTEALYFPLAALAIWAFVEGVMGRDWRWFAAAGILLALSALTRASMHYVFFFAIPVLVLALALGPRHDRRIRARTVPLLIVFLACYLATVAPWVVRNTTLTGTPSMVTGYSGLVISTRAAYNEMTWREYKAGWVYWLPDFGDDLAGNLFGADAIERLKFEGRDAIYPDVVNRIQQEASAATGVALGAPDPDGRLTAYILDTYILSQPLKHVAVSALLAWRGLFIGKYFGLAGLATMLAVLLLPAFGPIRGRFVLVALLPVFLLGLQAAISLNIPRYNILMLVPMALSMAIVLALIRQTIGDRIQARRAGVRDALS